MFERVRNCKRPLKTRACAGLIAALGGENGAALATVELLNVSLSAYGTWSAGPAMLTGRAFLSAVAAGGV